jgi:hypothetical protein
MTVTLTEVTDTNREAVLALGFVPTGAVDSNGEVIVAPALGGPGDAALP